MFFKNPLEKYASSLSANYMRAINGPYFCKSLREISKAGYDDIATQPKNEIYLVKEWSDTEEKMLDSRLTEDQKFYRRNGFLIKRNFIPHDLIEDYVALRQKLSLGDAGFGTPISYVEHPEIRRIAIYPKLVDLFHELHGMEMGLLVSHTRQRSTERGWHPDGYLKPEYRWPQAHFGAKNGELTWGGIVEAIIDPIVMKKIEHEKLTVESFCPAKGDVLIWHGRLVHRGAVPQVRKLSRPSIIGQYVPLHEKGRGMFMRNPDGGFFLVRSALYDSVRF